MINARRAAIQPDPRPPPMPSLETVAQQLGVDPETEPELMHLVTKMRTTPLPPTWVAVETTAAENEARHPSTVSSSTQPAGQTASAKVVRPRLEYLNRVSGERTQSHPGTSFFLAAVNNERKSGRWQARGDAGATSEPSPQGTSFCGNNGSIDKPNDSRNSGSIGGMIGSLSSPAAQEIEATVSTTSTNRDGQDQGQAAPFEFNSTSNITVVRRAKPEDSQAGSIANAAAKGATERCSATNKRASATRGKLSRRRVPPPKYLVFTSWWHETVSGTENIMIRKHASIRYATADGSFEVELEDVPAIFEVSHATGRYGKIETLDIRVGAQITILGRPMRLMQCDGLTAHWLESEVQAIKKAKVALISALEGRGTDVRVRCRSDRLEASASAQRGGDSVGHAAEMDRRALMQDVNALRLKLAETRPDEAQRLTKGLHFV